MYQQNCLQAYALAEQRVSERLERKRRASLRRGAAAIRLSVRRQARAQRGH